MDSSKKLRPKKPATAQPSALVSFAWYSRYLLVLALASTNFLVGCGTTHPNAVSVGNHRRQLAVQHDGALGQFLFRWNAGWISLAKQWFGHRPSRLFDLFAVAAGRWNPDAMQRRVRSSYRGNPGSERNTHGGCWKSKLLAYWNSQRQWIDNDRHLHFDRRPRLWNGAKRAAMERDFRTSTHRIDSRQFSQRPGRPPQGPGLSCLRDSHPRTKHWRQ